MKRRFMLVVLSVCACSPEPSKSGADGGAAGGSTGNSAGGSAGGSASGGGSTSATGARRTGSLSVIQTRVEVAGQTHYGTTIQGGFLEWPAGFPECGVRTFGACQVTDCTTAADAGAPPDGGFVSAGRVSISGLVDGGLDLELTPSGQYSHSLVGRALQPGMSLRVSASGATVPAFGTQVVMPPSVVLTAPSCSAGSCGALPKSDLRVTWTPSSFGKVGFSLASARESLSASCTFEASSGSGIVPAAALALLPTGPTSILFGGAESSSVSAGLFPVTVVAMESSVWNATLGP